MLNMGLIWPMLLVLFGSTSLHCAPVTTSNPEADLKGLNTEVDTPVEELEKLKLGGNLNAENAAKDSVQHFELHKTDAVKQNGDLVSRVEQHSSADKVLGEKPVIHSQAEIEIPAAGIHRVIEQDGDKISIQDLGASTTTTPSSDITTKVFHGAARLVQPGAASQPVHKTHAAVRRSFNADLTQETKHNLDHYSAFTGVQYSPLDMAEYVFWTGDEKGVTNAIEEFIQQGMMSKEEAISFLQEIKFNIEYLKGFYSQKASDDNSQHEVMRHKMFEQTQARDAFHYKFPSIQAFPFGSSPDIIHSINNNKWDISNSLTPPLSYLPGGEYRPEPVKRNYLDPMLQTNFIGTSDYDKEAPMISEEEYEEMMEKLRLADNLNTEYTLEEIIYHLAKMMFSQSLTRNPNEARAAIQRFMLFLETEAERGQLSRKVEKKVLDLMVAALSDTIGDHPESLETREGMALHNPAENRLMRQFYEESVAEPSMSRAILSAYKNELLKRPLPFAYPETK